MSKMATRLKKYWCKVNNNYRYMPQRLTILGWRDLCYPQGFANKEYAQDVLDRFTEITNG